MHSFRKIIGVFFSAAVFVILCFSVSSDIYAVNAPGIAQKTWMSFYCQSPTINGAMYIKNTYRYGDDLYIPFKRIPKLVENTYSEFDITWNPAKKRTEITKHTKNKEVWYEPDLPYDISVFPASASVYIDDVPTRIDGFLHGQIFFVRPEDFSKIIGFQIT